MTLSTVAAQETFKIIAGSTTRTFVASADGSGDSTDGSVRFFPVGADVTALADNLVLEIAAEAIPGITATAVAGKLILSGSTIGTTPNGFSFATASNAAPGTFGATSGTTGFVMGGGAASSTETAVVTLTTLSDGLDQNSGGGTEGTNNTLPNGTENNVRWEITSQNANKGTFNLIIRRGDDTSNRKSILEQHTNLTL